MKRLQIYIEEDLDEALAARALHEGTSKAALIRQFVAEKFDRSGGKYDPLDELVGRYDQEPGIIDKVVYGP
jgi:hypothetical protein